MREVQQFADMLTDASLKLRPQFREFRAETHGASLSYQENLRTIAMHKRNERFAKRPGRLRRAC